MPSASARREAVARGHACVSELKGVLELFFDDGLTDADDARMEKFGKLKRRGRLSLVEELNLYAMVAEPHRAQLDGFCDFSAATIDQARELGTNLQALRRRRDRAWLGGRNQLLHLLHLKVGEVRRAAAFVYRNHPQIAAQAASDWDRRRRAEARRRKAAATDAKRKTE